jgi:hypothetical protein
MDEYDRAPTTFYRVEDASSCARLIEGVGIRARRQTTYTWNHTALVKLVKNHLDWWNPSRSPFISVYDDLERAQHEAERREDKEHHEVVIWEIETSIGKDTGSKAEYRNLRRYRKKQKFNIPGFAWNMSVHEWLFLNEIPEDMIVRNCW